MRVREGKRERENSVMWYLKPQPTFDSALLLLVQTGASDFQWDFKCTFIALKAREGPDRQVHHWSTCYHKLHSYAVRPMGMPHQ